MSAVESGDMETAQRLVDEAALEWGAVTRGNARVQRPLHLYHGTGTFGFTRFRDGRIYATVSEGVAAGYNRGQGLGRVRSSSLGYIHNDGTIETAIKNEHLSGDGAFTKLCSTWWKKSDLQSAVSYTLMKLTRYQERAKIVLSQEMLVARVYNKRYLRF